MVIAGFYATTTISAAMVVVVEKADDEVLHDFGYLLFRLLLERS
jgi:hypothetical protein